MTTTTTPSMKTAKPLRADAVRNRERILAAARVVFAERGLDVTLDDIARQAGLGVGTVYRRFADRETLVEALFAERMQAKLEMARAALERPDPWRALVELLTATCEDLAADRGMHQVMLSSEYGQDRVARGREQLVPLVRELVRRAQAAGDLRPDFVAQDIPVLLLMIAAVADFAREVSPELWRRYLAVLIDGMRTQPGPPEQPVAGSLTEAQMDAATHSHRLCRR